MLQYWHDFLINQGGIFSSEESLHFGTPQEALSALGKQDGMTGLTQLGLLKIDGQDAKQFLQGQITLNLNDINPKQSGLGAHCDIKGRMQSLFRVFQTDQPSAYYLCMPYDMLLSTLQGFKKYALFSRVSIETVNNLAAIGLYGPSIDKRVNQLIPQSHQLQNDYECLTHTVNDDSYTLCRLPGEYPRFEIWASPQALINLWLKLKDSCTLVPSQAWELLDIQSGIPAVYTKTIGSILPHHANLSILKGISYSKGCYLGQEIIARMQYKGKIKKHLYRAYVQSAKEIPAPGDLVYGDALSEPGIVLRCAQNKDSAFEMLIVIDDQFKNFENVCLYSADGPKVHRLDLPYTW